MKSTRTKITFICSLLFAVIACDKNEPLPSDGTSATLENYANIVYATYDDAVITAKILQTTINDFTTNPTATTHEAAKKAWIAARVPYGQSEGFRFYGGPIDDDNGPEGLINGWPLDESYIDYVQGNATSGIINDAVKYPKITKELLISLNEEGSETNLSTGYHAIEFLLWGQDFNPDGPGERVSTDYTTRLNAERRKQYLKVATDLLVENLTQVRDAWREGSAYRTDFTTDANAALGKMFRGIGALSKGELAGERMTVALANQDQEDEHSCFSDNTHQDIRMNFLSVKNVYTGSYKRVDGSTVSGASLANLVAAKNENKNMNVLNFLTSTEKEVYAIPAPFDKAITSGDPEKKIEKAILNLRKLSDSFVDAALALKIQLNTDLD